MSSRARRNTNKRSRGQSRGVSHSAFHRAERGQVLKVGPNPPEIVEIPWNSVTLQVAGSGDSTVVGTSLLSPLSKQLGFSNVTGLSFDFRIVKVRAWCLNSKRPIRMEVYGLDSTKTSKAGSIQILTDYPSNVQYASVGYVLPQTLQNIVWSTDSTDPLVAIDVGATYQWLMYIDILWRGNQLTAFTETVGYQSYAKIAAGVGDLAIGQTSS